MQLLFSISHKDKSGELLEHQNFDTIDYPIPQEGTVVILKSKTWIVDNIVYNFDGKIVIVFLMYTKGK